VKAKKVVDRNCIAFKLCFTKAFIMENENAFQNFDDLIFENRNKQYGAYAIRKSYNDNVSKAVLIAVLSSGLIITLSAFTSKEKPTEKSNPKDSTIVFGDPPKIIVEPPPAKVLPRVKSISNNHPPVVTTEDVEPPIEVKTDNASNSDGTETGVAVVDTGTGTLTDVGPVVDITPAEPTNTPRNFAEVMPQFVGGHTEMTRYLRRMFRYPAIARRTVTEGTVYVSFVIDAQGNVTNVKIEKGISKECDEEAMRIIAAMPKWMPGRQGDQLVSVRQYLPIKFELNFE
jgi:protein TonB